MIGKIKEASSLANLYLIKKGKYIMKNIAALLILIIIICSCKYKIVSPFDGVSDSINDNNSNKNLYIIDANATEAEIKDALQKNIESTGKNIIVVVGYIGANSKIFDNIKNALKNKTNIELDLSKAVMESNYIYTLENALFVTKVYFASSQKIIANFFKDCTSLVNVQLPSLLLIIDNSSFENCNSLKNIEYLGTSPNTIAGTPFSGTVITGGEIVIRNPAAVDRADNIPLIDFTRLARQNLVWDKSSTNFEHLIAMNWIGRGEHLPRSHPGIGRNIPDLFHRIQGGIITVWIGEPFLQQHFLRRLPADFSRFDGRLEFFHPLVQRPAARKNLTVHEFGAAQILVVPDDEGNHNGIVSFPKGDFGLSADAADGLEVEPADVPPLRSFPPVRQEAGIERALVEKFHFRLVKEKFQLRILLRRELQLDKEPARNVAADVIRGKCTGEIRLAAGIRPRRIASVDFLHFFRRHDRLRRGFPRKAECREDRHDQGDFHFPSPGYRFHDAFIMNNRKRECKREPICFSEKFNYNCA